VDDSKKRLSVPPTGNRTPDSPARRWFLSPRLP